MKDRLEKVTDITQLKPGDKIISIGVTSEILEFLCIHPHKHFSLATDKDITDYRKALRDHRITWEDNGRFYHYPHVGDHYFEIFFNHGVADFRELVMDSEANRPEISRLIMECNMTYNRELRESRVRKRVEEINKALGLK